MEEITENPFEEDVTKNSTDPYGLQSNEFYYDNGKKKVLFLRSLHWDEITEKFVVKYIYSNDRKMSEDMAVFMVENLEPAKGQHIKSFNLHEKFHNTSLEDAVKSRKN